MQLRPETDGIVGDPFVEHLHALKQSSVRLLAGVHDEAALCEVLHDRSDAAQRNPCRFGDVAIGASDETGITQQNEHDAQCSGRAAGPDRRQILRAQLGRRSTSRDQHEQVARAQVRIAGRVQELDAKPSPSVGDVGGDVRRDEHEVGLGGIRQQILQGGRQRPGGRRMRDSPESTLHQSVPQFEHGDRKAFALHAGGRVQATHLQPGDVFQRPEDLVDQVFVDLAIHSALTICSFFAYVHCSRTNPSLNTLESPFCLPGRTRPPDRSREAGFLGVRSRTVYGVEKS